MEVCNMTEYFQQELINLLVFVITTCVGIATRYLVSLLKKKGVLYQIESHKELAKIVVNAIEQVYKYSNGQEKFEMAKQELAEMLQKKKINITEKEIVMIIEAAVREMNKAYKETKK